jgi:hypothetical protein
MYFEQTATGYRVTDEGIAAWQVRDVCPACGEILSPTGTDGTTNVYQCTCEDRPTWTRKALTASTVFPRAHAHTRAGPQARRPASKEDLMTETRTCYVIQIHSTVIPRWTDLDGQLTDGYISVEQARKALAGGWWDLDRLKGTLGGEVRFRIVERTVTETPFEI